MTSGLGFLGSRAIRFQLTALMDLLLIMVFAQYLEFQRLTIATQEHSDREISNARESFESELRRQIQESNRDRERALLESRRSQQVKEEALLIADEAVRRQGLLEDLLRKVLQVDADMLDQEHSPAEAIDAFRNVETTARAIRDQNGTELLRFLAGYQQLLKRAEVWTIHVSDRGDTELQVGNDRSRAQSFRLEKKSQADRTEEFVQQLKAAAAQLPQPKGLVVILVSYSPRAIAGNYQPVLDGMPQAIDGLEQDTAGLTQFQYSVIGAISDPARDLSTELPNP